MKRYISLILAALILLSLFSGCSQSAETPAPSESAASETSAQPESPALSSEPIPAEPSGELEPPPEDAAPVEDEPVSDEWVYTPITYPLTEEVEVFTLWTIFELSPGCNMTDINDHPQLVTSAEETGVTLEVTSVSQSAGTELTNLMIASGDYTDLLSSYNFTIGVDGAIDEGIILDVRPYLEQFAPDCWQLLIDTDGLKTVATDEGNIGAFPAIGTGGRGPSTGMQIRKDWLDELGLDIPNTFEEYETVLEAFMVNYDLDIAFYLPQDGIMENNQLCAAYGVPLKISDMQGTKGFFQVDGVVKFGYAEEGFVEYITMMNDWYNKGYINSSFLSALPSGVDGNLVTKVRGSKVGIYSLFDGLIDMFTNTAEDPNAEFVAIPDAVKNKGDQTHFGNAKNAAGGGALMMMSSCRDPELITKWANYWYTDEGAMYTQWGYLGKTYEIGTDGKPYYTEFMTNNPDGLILSEVKMEWTGFIAFVNDDSEPEASLSINAQNAPLVWGQNKDGDYELPGSLTLTVDEGSTLTNLFSDISTYCLENTAKFIMGDLPLSDLESFQAQLWDMKLQECCDIYQAAYNRYLIR